MRRTGTHTHPCRYCQTPEDCRGELLPNHDGFPEVICHSYHVCGTPAICEACFTAQGEACHDCGDRADVQIDDSDDASGYKGAIYLCHDCIAKRQAA
jgi:hypothetical protein